MTDYSPTDRNRASQLVQMYNECYEAMTDEQKMRQDKLLDYVTGGMKNFGDESAKELIIATMLFLF